MEKTIRIVATIFLFLTAASDRKQGAPEAWNKLLSTDPSYPDRERVQQIMQQLKMEARSHFSHSLPRPPYRLSS